MSHSTGARSSVSGASVSATGRSSRRDSAFFGFFRTEMLDYNRKYGYTETGKIYLANRYDLWQHTFGTTAGTDGLQHTDQTKPISFAHCQTIPLRIMSARLTVCVDTSWMHISADQRSSPPRGRCSRSEAYA